MYNDIFELECPDSANKQWFIDSRCNSATWSIIRFRSAIAKGSGVAMILSKGALPHRVQFP